MTFVGRCKAALFLAILSAPGHVLAATTNVFNFARPLDVAQVRGQDAGLPSADTETNGQGETLRRLSFQVAERPTLTLAPKQGVWDWSAQKAVALRVQNAMDWDLTLVLRVESEDGGVLESRVPLRAGPAQTLLLPLSATQPRAFGMRAGPGRPWQADGKRYQLATEVSGKLDLARVKGLSLSLESPKAAQHVLVGRVDVQDEDALAFGYDKLIDAYGQSTHDTWPGKITADAQLAKAAADERKQLQGWLQERAGLDRFGGWKLDLPLKSTGYFHVEKQNGQWYLVTPEGNAFFSVGVNTVTPEVSQTYVSGREWMFTQVPTADQPLGQFAGEADNRSGNGANRGREFATGHWYDFYAANRQRTYGNTNLDAWRAQALDRLRAWGFNTLGGWSEGVFNGDERIPYTVSLSIQGDFATIDTGNAWWGGVPDPFDPRFAMATERAIAIAARGHGEDPWLIGYFADNELAWASPGAEPQARYALAYATLRLTTDVPAKRAFLKQLRDKYRNQEGLSKAWGIQLPAWELLEDPGFQAPVPSEAYPAIEADYRNFLEFFAETYFKTISDALKWHAPNHLLLGGRFAVSTPEAVTACARYCDVMSFNFYTTLPQEGYDFATLRQLDKPVLISEFHFGSRDRGPFWGGVVEVADEAQRGPAYARYLEQAVRDPLIVGAHWFQYLDQPTSGRILDGENGHLGLVAITDRPWGDFVTVVRKANLQVPQWQTEKARTAVPAAEPSAKPNPMSAPQSESPKPQAGKVEVAPQTGPAQSAATEPLSAKPVPPGADQSLDTLPAPAAGAAPEAAPGSASTAQNTDASVPAKAAPAGASTEQAPASAQPSTAPDQVQQP